MVITVSKSGPNDRHSDSFNDYFYELVRPIQSLPSLAYNPKKDTLYVIPDFFLRLFRNQTLIRDGE